jgi:hypothetical protein
MGYSVGACVHACKRAHLCVGTRVCPIPRLKNKEITESHGFHVDMKMHTLLALTFFSCINNEKFWKELIAYFCFI